MKSVSIFPTRQGYRRPHGPPEFPITQHLRQVYTTIGNKSLSESQRRYIVLSAPTGTGKTLGIPISFATRREKALVRIAVPTTIAAKKARDYVSTNTNISVGYATGRNREYSNSDRIVYMTAGYLVNRLLWIIKNERWSELIYTVGHLLMIDESHSGSKDVSVLFGLMKYLESHIRPIIIIASATGSGDALDYFPNPSFINITQTAYPVEIKYENISPLQASTAGLNEYIANVCAEQRKNGAKIGIVFRPGRREVSDTIVYLLDKLENRNLKVLAAVSGSDISELDAKFNGFKVIVGTNFIESSVTIENADFVIDDMLEKKPVKSLAGGKKLELSLISKSSSNQRIGRVGRTKPGKAIRMINRNDYKLLSENNEPEILRIPIDDIVLKFVRAGLTVTDILKIPLRDYLVARNNLLTLGMLDSNGITPKGNFASNLQLGMQNVSIIHSALLQLKVDKSIGTFLAVKSAVAVAVMLETHNNGFFWRPFKENGETKEAFAQRQAVARNQQEPLIGDNDIDTLLTMFWNFMQYRLYAYLGGNKPMWMLSAEWCKMYSVNNVRWKQMLSLFRVVNQRIYDFSSYYERMDTMSLGVPLGEQLNPILQRLYPGIMAAYSRSKFRKIGYNSYINDITGAFYSIRDTRGKGRLPDDIYALEILQLRQRRYATLYLSARAGEEKEVEPEIDETQVIELDDADLESALDDILGFNGGFESRADETIADVDIQPIEEIVDLQDNLSNLLITDLQEPESKDDSDLLEGVFIEEL